MVVTHLSKAQGQRNNIVALCPGAGVTTKGSWIRFLAIVAFLIAAGCSDTQGLQLAEVSGTVMLNEKPLADAIVVFKPKQGRSSVGKTDAEGNFKLIYLKDIYGARLGRHQVSIQTAIDEEGTTSERIPARYNRKTELRKEVESGANHFEFTLVSE